jgi:23S rRNA (adenine2030-N6)-methyltransferase
MNYRHAFHAGNFADVLKHVVLIMLVEHLKRKQTPFFYLDTHAGGGTYDLSLGESQRSGEYKNGIGRLLEFPEAALAPEVAQYVRLVKECAGPGRSAITAYPGSPTIVAKMRRLTDRMVLVETHAREAQALRSALGWQKLVSVLESDGYAAIKAQVPPREKRGMVLIDSTPSLPRSKRVTHAGRPAPSVSGTRSRNAQARCDSVAVSNPPASARCSTSP